MPRGRSQRDFVHRRAVGGAGVAGECGRSRWVEKCM